MAHPTIIRNCPNCGKEFECDKFHLSKMYCGDKCKLALNREHNRQLERKRRCGKRKVLTSITNRI